MPPEDTAKSSGAESSTAVEDRRGVAAEAQRNDKSLLEQQRLTGNRTIDSPQTGRPQSGPTHATADAPRTIGNRYTLPEKVPRSIGNRYTLPDTVPRSIGNRYTLPESPVAASESPATKPSWASTATPENVSQARSMDELESLSDTDLLTRRSQVAFKAVDHSSYEQQAALRTLENIEFIASMRQLSPMKMLDRPDLSLASQRRFNVRIHLEEGVRLTGSFQEAMERSYAPAEDKRHFNEEAKRFALEFRSKAVSTALRMLDGSQRGIERMLISYGLPNDETVAAANRFAQGSDLEREVAHVIGKAIESKHINEDRFKRHRVDLMSRARRLRQLQEEATPGGGRGSHAPVTDLPAAQKKLDDAWNAAVRAHPVLSAFLRTGGAISVDLAPLAGSSVENVMSAILKTVLPKLRDIRSASALIKAPGRALDPLSLPAVVALTRTRMFIPEGSLRDGVARDVVSKAAKPDSLLPVVASFALVVIALIPSMGASLAIPLGAAGIALGAYEVSQSWQEYGRQSTLSNTDLELAKSLYTEVPSMASFVISLVLAGFDLAAPLLRELRKLRLLRKIVAGGDDAAAAARAAGKAPRPRVPKKPGPVPKADPSNTLGEPVMYMDSGAMRKGFQKALTEESNALRKALAAKKAGAVDQTVFGTEKVNPMMIDFLEGFRFKPSRRFIFRKNKDVTLDDLERHLKDIVTADMEPLTADMISVLKQLPKAHRALRDPELLGKVAEKIWRYAAKHQITPAKALERLSGGKVRRVFLKTEDEFRQAGMIDSPWVDLFIADDNHGAYTHMFQELVLDEAFGKKGAGRRLRVQIVNLKGGPVIFERTGRPGRGPQSRKFWAAAWDALADDFNGQHHLNHPETVGKALIKHLGLPMWRHADDIWAGASPR